MKSLMRVQLVLSACLISACGAIARGPRERTSAPLVTAEWAVAALRIRGTVQDSAGRYLPGVSVGFMECAPNAAPTPCNDYGVAHTLTDSSGRFSVVLRHPGVFGAFVIGERLPFVEYRPFHLPADSASILTLRVPVGFKPQG